MEIEISYESKRGCGYRQPGGKYLVSGGLMKPCGKLPIPLEVCPTCHAGIKPSRGWTWIDGDKFIEGRECGRNDCHICPLAESIGRVGLLWIGEQYYKTTNEFITETIKMGVSRRISAIPKDFKLGETRVLLAHRKAIHQYCSHPNADSCEDCKDCDEQGNRCTPGIFHAFRPTAIEYIVKGGETKDELEQLVERGITLVKVKRIGETGELLPDESKGFESVGDKDKHKVMAE